jgi:phytoene dehydrogenase-like protein
VPWAAAGCELAGTLHLGGTRAEMAAGEADVAAGRHPDRPFVLAAQPGVVDPSRAPAGYHTLWAYGHVPAGSTRDLGEAVTAQVERFAPGFRDVVVHRSVMTAAQEAVHNANYVGGDIASGATTPWQMVMRPVPRWDPYRTPLEGTYLCSASTPPGPAVHGMAGVHAARRALRQVFGDRRDPLDLVRALP